jgi:hypothetical protein
MNAPRKPTARTELDHIEDALVEAILNTTDEDLRAEIKAVGDEPGQLITAVDLALTRAQSECARVALQTARTELAAWRSNDKTRTLDRDSARVRFEKMRSGDPALAAKMMMAARKGEGLSDRDLDGLLDDIAELERFEREEGEE